MKALVEKLAEVNVVESHKIMQQCFIGVFNLQYHVLLTYSNGTTKSLWMDACDYIDWIENPMDAGKVVHFNADKYQQRFL